MCRADNHIAIMRSVIPNELGHLINRFFELESFIEIGSKIEMRRDAITLNFMKTPSYFNTQMRPKITSACANTRIMNSKLLIKECSTDSFHSSIFLTFDLTSIDIQSFQLSFDFD